MSRAGRGAETSLGLVVPLFDEAARFDEFGGALVDFITAQPVGSQLVFVDDGSADGTPELVAGLLARRPAAPARLLRRPHRGKGAAVAAGLSSLDTAYAAFCDVDLSTPLDQLERIIHLATRAEVLAIGSRDMAGSELVRPESRVREALGRSYNRLIQATVAPGVVDTQCGAKAASAAVWGQLLPHCRETGFAWDAELIAVARALGVDVAEIPIRWLHDPRTKVRVLHDGMAMVRATPRIWRSARRAAAARPAAAPAMPPGPTSSAERFDQAHAATLLAPGRSHWWFRSKAALVATAIRATSPDVRTDGWMVDLGGGSGEVTSLLGWDPGRTVVLDGNPALIGHARAKLGLSGIRGEVDHIPLRDRSLEAVCLLDVLEHLDDPGATLQEARRVLAPSGRLIVHVPAHPWLWSTSDEQLGHRRRYTRRLLTRELADAGFEPVMLTHVFSWLTPIMWLFRRVVRPATPETGLDRTAPWIDRVALVLTGLERHLIGRLSLPIGTSVLCVARPSPHD